MAEPITVPFPTAGSMTVRANEAGAVVNASKKKEHVICTVTVEGGRAAFVFRRDGVTLQDSATQPVSAKYQWVLSATDGTLLTGEATYSLAIAFIGALKYGYKMELCDEFGARLRMLKDVDYKSAEPTDSRVEPISIEVR